MQFNKDIESEHRFLFLQVREYFLSFMDIEETKKKRITSYSNAHGVICHLRTMPNGVDIGFAKGVQMNDPEHLLIGKGKAIRVLKLVSFKHQTIDFFFQQALQLNTAKN